jgi:murein DD-endopeptidase MepM/ murein hydrolase activator NlpD
MMSYVGKRGRRLLAVALLAAGPVCHAETSTTTTKSAWSIRLQPARLINGSPLIFRVSAPARLESLSAKWLNHDIYFSYDSRSRAWYGIAGVSLETRPGTYPLVLDGTTKDGKNISFRRQLLIHAAKYRSIAVTVAHQYTAPSAEQLQEISEDKTLKEEAFQHINPEREWAGSFQAPVKAPVSDQFGTRRTFNGKVQSTHQGLDYAVPAGTPVLALNRGTVLLARPLFFEGNCVVLDHGQGLLTLYLHLSEFKVKEGDQVNRGEEIALSGGTGRASGPHLHVAVRWEGVYLNPATLLRLKLP